ncbi:hypothetical protein ACSVDM_18245 [Nocardia sp. JW2]|uniref:hypothetical protein n=1 Tax=Nocardia sp. JW2 TaxID=3450738 RepID=UPI003F4401B0
MIRSPQMLRAQPLPPSRKIPLDFFTYRIIPVDEDTRLILVATGVAGRPGWLAAYWRSDIAVEITGTVDTEWLYAGMGYIGGFRYHGRIAEHRVAGLAYLEYSDRRR